MKFKKYIVLGALATGLFSSCNLDKFPYSSIETSQSLTNVSDAKNWDNNFYADLRGRVYGIYTYVTDAQADQLNASFNYGNNLGAEHRWTDFLSDNYSIRDIWSGYYGAIRNINKAIEGFEALTPANDAEAAALKQYIGDAHLARAYYYFCLNARFAKAYNPATANTDLSVPLELKYNLESKPARSTVAQVYNQILTDLNVAKTNLASVAGAPNAFRFNIDVATAFEARVKLFMKDMNGAKTAAESLISANKYALYNTQAGVQSMWYNDAGNEVIFAPKVIIASELPNTNAIYLGLNTGNNKYTPTFLPSKWVYDMYPAGDFRKQVYFKTNGVVFLNGADRTGILINKYPGNPALTTGATNYAHSPKVFRIAEIYLIAAEASYEANPGVALTYLNTLRVARGLTALSGLSGAGLLKEIKDERFRELAFEGFRLDDLKRWGEGFQRHDPQSLDLLQTGADFVSKTVAANDDKFTWGLPTNDITINTNLVQNKGW